MNRERMKALLPVMKAFAEGKEVQVRHNGHTSWGDASSPVWHENRQYRIKPPPPRVLLRIEDETGRMYQTSWEAERKTMISIVEAWNKDAVNGCRYRLVEYVEKVEG